MDIDEVTKAEWKLSGVYWQKNLELLVAEERRVRGLVKARMDFENTFFDLSKEEQAKCQYEFIKAVGMEIHEFKFEDTRKS